MKKPQKPDGWSELRWFRAMASYGLTELHETPNEDTKPIAKPITKKAKKR